jgi:hypothetical protein
VKETMGVAMNSSIATSDGRMKARKTRWGTVRFRFWPRRHAGATAASGVT